MAGFFPVFFKEYWSNTDSVTLSTWYLGLANSIASIVVAAIAPFIGAIADRGTAKKKFLILFAFLGIISTGALWIVKQGEWEMAVLFYVFGSIGFAAGNERLISAYSQYEFRRGRPGEGRGIIDN